ncbi:hypothetical protein OAL14_04220 [Gammaproteobacteria bacterium]|nr:hypothetical protein [Gammaproteobacteria bacterium]
MKIKTIFTLLITGMIFSLGVMADDHDATEQRPVELWICSFNEGKTVDDIDDWYADFNEFADSMKNNRLSSYMWVPNFVSDLDRADVILSFGFPSLTAMGQTMDEFFGSEGGSKLFQTYQEILDCSGREIWQVSQKRSVD